jgi:hypothetical protein
MRLDLVTDGASADAVAADVVAERGSAFAASFIERVSPALRGAGWLSPLGGAAIRLVSRFGLAVPDGIGYLEDWALYAAVRLGLSAQANPS